MYVVFLVGYGVGVEVDETCECVQGGCWIVETWDSVSGSDRGGFVTVIYHSPGTEDVLACSYEMAVE